MKPIETLLHCTMKRDYVVGLSRQKVHTVCPGIVPGKPWASLLTAALLCVVSVFHIFHMVAENEEGALQALFLVGIISLAAFNVDSFFLGLQWKLREKVGANETCKVIVHLEDGDERTFSFRSENICDVAYENLADAFESQSEARKDYIEFDYYSYLRDQEAEEAEAAVIAAQAKDPS